MEIKVQVKQAGRRENKIVTAKLLLKQAPKTAGELIASTVKAAYAAHYEKANEITVY